MAALFYASDLGDRSWTRLAFSEQQIVRADPLGPCTQVDLSDGVPDDWELGVGFLPGMDEVRVDRARLDLRGLAVSVPAEDWSCERQDSGWRITLARPARLVSIGFDALPELPAPAETRRVLLSPADPPGPPAFVSPPFRLGSAYPELAGGMTVSLDGSTSVARIPPTLGASWLLQWAEGEDATKLDTVEVDTQVRSITIQRAVTDVRLELRPDDPSGEPVLVWNHPGVLDPGSGLQLVDLSPIARKRLADRLVTANARATSPPALSLPVRLVAAAGGPVGVSGTELEVTYIAHAIGAAVALELRGDPLPVALLAPAELRPAAGTVSVAGRHLGREVNGRVGPSPGVGGPGLLVVGDRWAARAVRVAETAAGDAVLVAVTVDLGAEAQAEVSVEVRSDVQGLPGPVLAGAALRLEPGRAGQEVILPSPVAASAGQVVWISVRATVGEVRWYSEVPAPPGAVPDPPAPAARVSGDRGETWAPVDERLSVGAVPRARLLHRVDPPFRSPVVVTIEHGGLRLGEITLSQVPTSDGEYGLAAGAVPAAVLDLLGRAPGSGEASTTVAMSSPTALDVTITGFDLTYSPTAGPTPS